MANLFKGYPDYGYATVPNALRELDRALALIGETRDSVRWFIAVNLEHPKYVPCVLLTHSGRDANIIGLAHVSKVCIVS